jgi:hypothetical protein
VFSQGLFLGIPAWRESGSFWSAAGCRKEPRESDREGLAGRRRAFPRDLQAQWDGRFVRRLRSDVWGSEGAADKTDGLRTKRTKPCEFIGEQHSPDAHESFPRNPSPRENTPTTSKRTQETTDRGCRHRTRGCSPRWPHKRKLNGNSDQKWWVLRALKCPVLSSSGGFRHARRRGQWPFCKSDRKTGVVRARTRVTPRPVGNPVIREFRMTRSGIQDAGTNGGPNGPNGPNRFAPRPSWWPRGWPKPQFTTPPPSAA